MPTTVWAAQVCLIVPRGRIAAWVPLLIAQLEQKDTYREQKDRYQGLLNTLALDQLLLWLLGTMGWIAEVLPNGDIQLRRFGEIQDVENDPVLMRAEHFVEEGSYVEGYVFDNQQWLRLIYEKGRVRRARGAIFPHYRPKLPDRTSRDIVTESSFWRAVEEVALWHLRLSEAEQKEVLKDYEDEEDVLHQVWRAISNAMMPTTLEDYIALMQILPDVWNSSYPDTILEDDENPTPERVFDDTLARLIYDHLEEQWVMLEGKASLLSGLVGD